MYIAHILQFESILIRVMLQLSFLYLTNFFPSYLSVPGLCRFGMEYKEFATEMETLYDFQYFLMRLRLFDIISNYKQANLLNIYLCKVDDQHLHL